MDPEKQKELTVNREKDLRELAEMQGELIDLFNRSRENEPNEELNKKILDAQVSILELKQKLNLPEESETDSSSIQSTTELDFPNQTKQLKIKKKQFLLEKLKTDSYLEQEEKKVRVDILKKTSTLEQEERKNAIAKSRNQNNVLLTKNAFRASGGICIVLLFLVSLYGLFVKENTIALIPLALTSAIFAFMFVRTLFMKTSIKDGSLEVKAKIDDEFQ